MWPKTKMVISKVASSLAMEGSNDGGSISRMLSIFQSSEKRASSKAAVESALPQVTLRMQSDNIIPIQKSVRDLMPSKIYRIITYNYIS